MVDDSGCRIAELEQEVSVLRQQLSEAQSQLAADKLYHSDVALHAHQAERYARQITLKVFGPHAQETLLRSSALIVGAGGLGCPCALYLAAAGVGTIGVVDRDRVSLSNLHRQVAHSQARVGAHKADSLAASLRDLNNDAVVHVHRDGLSPGNAARLCSGYDVVVDCSDNAPTRYVVNDAAVVCGRPVVSGAAVGTEGQLTVYHHDGGPCYRCEDTGVLGPVPGVIGTLQAMEAIKVLTGVGASLSQKLLLFDGLTSRFTTVRLRPRSAACTACAHASEIKQLPNLARYDYDAFTAGQPLSEGQSPVSLLSADERLTPAQAAALLADSPREAAGGCLVLDVRPWEQFATARLPGALHCPPDKIQEFVDTVAEHFEGGGGQVLVVCRQGNDSQGATRFLLDQGFERVHDVKGGMNAWSDMLGGAIPKF